MATSALQELCRIAGERYGLRALTARATNDNLASQRVLRKVGFVASGSTEIDGRQGSQYELVLAEL